jgi:hypothetical protein
MNNSTITLPTLSANETYTFSEQVFFDSTEVTIDITRLSEEYFPIYLYINWGDGVSETFQNEIMKDYTVDDITNEVLYGKISNLFSKKFCHLYKPSKTCLYKLLSATIKIEYPNNNLNVFYIPIKIRTNDFFESVLDIKLKNTNITTKGDKEHQFITKNEGSLVELKTSVK